MKKILGLDLGTNSIGWALISEEENIINKIEGIGCRIIPEKDEHRDYESGRDISKNAIRRQKRGSRRLNERYKIRRNSLLKLCNAIQIFPKGLEPLFVNGFTDKEIELTQSVFKTGDYQYRPQELYELRTKALTERISLEELFRIIYHLNQRRGFKSNKKALTKDEGNNKEIFEEEKKRFEINVERVKIIKVEPTGEKKGKLKKEEFKITLEDGRTAITDKFIFKKFEGETSILEIKKESIKSSLEPKYTYNIPSKWKKNRKELNDAIGKSGGFPGKYFYEEFLKAKEEKRLYEFKVRESIVNRELYENEFECIWNKQYKLWKNDGVDINFLSNYHKAIESIVPVNNKEEKEKWIESGLGEFIKKYIIYYQRDLKSQTKNISDCRFEEKYYKITDEETGEIVLKRNGPKCCPKSHPQFQEFRIWQQINNLICRDDREEEFQLPEESRVSLFNYLNERETAEPEDILKFLKKKNDLVASINVVKNWTGNKTLHFFKKIFKANDYDGIHILNNNKKYIQLWHLLYSVGDEKGIKTGLRKIDPNLTEGLIKTFCEVDYKEKQYSSMSLKAINNLLPLMRCGILFNEDKFTEKCKERIQKFLLGTLDDEFDEKTLQRLNEKKAFDEFRGLSYYQAASLLYGKHSAKQSERYERPEDILPIPQHSLRNPVVEQIVNETLMLVKDIWKQYPELKDSTIRVELARELKSNKEERQRISESQDKNRKENQIIVDEIRRHKGHNYNPTLAEIEKVKLWKEAGMQSPYTNNSITISDVLSENTEIDHIIPRTRFYNDGLINKVVCESHINSDKGNLTAFEYINTGTKCQNEKLNYDDFLQFIKRFSYFKRKMLTMKEIPEDFIERQIKDTQYIVTRIKEELGKIVGNQNVKTTTGSITDYLKEQWGIAELTRRLIKPRFDKLQENFEISLVSEEDIIGRNSKPTGKKRTIIKGYSKRFDHRHHAIDALIVACTRQGIIQQLNLLNQITNGRIKRIEETNGNSLRKFLPPTGKDDRNANSFYGMVENAVNSIIVSYKNRKRLVSKGINWYQKFNPEKGKIEKVKQDNSNLWAIKGQLHDELPFGKIFFDKREIPVEDTFERTKDIIDEIEKEAILNRIKTIKENAPSKKEKNKAISLAKKSVDENPIMLNGKRLEWIWVKEGKQLYVKNRKLYDANAQNKTLSIAQLKRIANRIIRNEIMNHLNKLQYEGKTEKAFGPEGLVDFNDERVKAGNPPIFSVRVIEECSVDDSIGKVPLYSIKRKLDVEKGGNFCVAFYEHPETKDRKFDVVSFFDAVQLKTADENPFQTEKGIEIEKQGFKFIFTLTHNDIVYVPEEGEETESIDWKNKGKIFSNIYRVVKFSGEQFYFQPHNYSKEITIHKGKAKSAKEYMGEFAKGTNGTEFIIGTKISIKNICIKLQVDRLGNIKQAI